MPGAVSAGGNGPAMRRFHGRRAARNPARIRTRFPARPKGLPAHSATRRASPSNSVWRAEYGRHFCHLRSDGTPNPEKERAGIRDDDHRRGARLGFAWNAHERRSASREGEPPLLRERTTSDFSCYRAGRGPVVAGNGLRSTSRAPREMQRPAGGHFAHAGAPGPYRSQTPRENLGRRLRQMKLERASCRRAPRVMRAKIENCEPEHQPPGATGAL